MTKLAVLSVYDKSNLVAFAQGLAKLEYALIASGGTARILRAAGLPVTSVTDITGAPEMLGGRVKTLHPAIHGGILARSTPADLKELAAQGYRPIDLVVCNLYPFQQTIAQAEVTLAEAVEQIDIGGVTLLRAAAKNFARVTVVSDPADYATVLAGLLAGSLAEDGRRQLAAKAFSHTRDYDTAVAAYIGETEKNLLPERINLQLTRTQSLRYGENPHQAAALYANRADAGPLGGILLQGKPLSYNNLLDLDAAWLAALAFSDPTVVIVKHLSPCGIASAETAAQAFPLALASDPVSAFGGVIAVNRQVDAAFCQAVDTADLFVEAVIAPGFRQEAKDWFARHKKNCRLVAVAAASQPRLEMRAIQGGFLGQEMDAGDPAGTQWHVVSQRQPTEAEWAALRFGWTAVQHVKSNAIVLAAGTATVGIGGGLPSRVDAVKLAAAKAGGNAQGAVLASDAFFPFPDGVEEAAKVGITAVIEPGGSIRDDQVIEAADRLGLALVFTNVRHFRH
jgi:phosphoribosylaminoimidazolecarboxamide formyltransferase/IMP cyclohydrolase